MPQLSKKTILLVVLSSIFLSNALLAELIGVKIFSLEGTFSLPLAQIPLFGYALDFNLTAGVLIWPVVFLVTDLLNEYFGKRGVRQISLLTAILILYAFLVIYVSIQLVPASFWQNINATDPSGRAFDINHAYSRLFGQGLGIIVGSLAAFLLGQLLDVYVFQYIRRRTSTRLLWLRATGSTLVSQLVDSFVVLFLAFYALAPEELRWSFSQIIAVAMMNYTYKFVAAVGLTPLLYVAHGVIDKYLGASLSEDLKSKAGMRTNTFF